MPKISACIVAYCDYDEVCSAVRSVLANTPGDDFALYVVDNASPDGCGPRLAQTDFGDVRVQVICLPKNLGFGKGHNSIMDRLTSDVHFILNPDVIIHDDILPQMAQWLLDHPGVVMATPSSICSCGPLCWRSWRSTLSSASIMATSSTLQPPSRRWRSCGVSSVPRFSRMWGSSPILPSPTRRRSIIRAR